MAVSLSIRPAFSPKSPTELFEKRSLRSMDPQYDVSPDGRRFVILDRRRVNSRCRSMWFTTRSKNSAASSRNDGAVRLESVPDERQHPAQIHHANPKKQ